MVCCRNRVDYMRSMDIDKIIVEAMKGSVLFLTLALVGCTPSGKASLDQWYNPHKVSLLDCEGRVTHEWTSLGEVQTVDRTRFFVDAATGKYMSVSGTTIVE